MEKANPYLKDNQEVSLANMSTGISTQKNEGAFPANVIYDGEIIEQPDN